MWCSPRCYKGSWMREGAVRTFGVQSEFEVPTLSKRKGGAAARGDDTSVTGNYLTNTRLRLPRAASGAEAPRLRGFTAGLKPRPSRLSIYETGSTDGPGRGRARPCGVADIAWRYSDGRYRR